MSPQYSNVQRALPHSVGVARIDAAVDTHFADAIGLILLRRREEQIPFGGRHVVWNIHSSM